MPMMEDPRLATQRYQATQSGTPIKIMTMGFLAVTAAFAYNLYQKKSYPWQHGHKLSDLWKDRKW